MRLTPDIAHTIVTYIEAGGFDYIAAEAAGIDARTFRDWMARGEGRHPTRAPTPELARFAKTVRQAKARARLAVEIRVQKDNGPFWLTRAARSKPGREGWTDPVDDPSPDDAASSALDYQPSLDEAREILQTLMKAGVLDPGEPEQDEPSEEASDG